MSEGANPVIVKKIKKGHGGHHGGAWKLAYADFVTAMMAFFLLMWLLGTTEPAFRQGIAEYFQDPWKPSSEGGPNTGDATSVIDGGGEDITQSEGQVKLTNEGAKDIVTEAHEGKILDKESSKTEGEAAKVPPPLTAAEEKQVEPIPVEKVLSEAEKQEQLEKARLGQLQEQLEQMLAEDPMLSQFKDQLKLDVTGEGLRIQIIDEENRPMFSLAKAKLESYASYIIDQIAPVINELPNRISISGHTDSRAYPGTDYTNWELSADRANAARKELVKAGLHDEKVLRIVGLASSVPFKPEDTADPTNRRISIIVLNKHTEEAILQAGGIRISEKDLPKSTADLHKDSAVPVAPVSSPDHAVPPVKVENSPVH